MPTDYQTRLTRENAPTCRYRGLRLPKRLYERGVCDYCHAAHLDDPVKFWQDDPERDLPTDAVAFEERGPVERERLPKRDSTTLAVEREREANDRRFRGGYGSSQFRKRGRR